MRALLIAGLLMGCGAEEAGLATMRLPIAAALPDRVDGFELQVDGVTHRFEAPFADPLFVEVEAGRIDTVRAVGTVAGAPVLVGFATDVLVEDGATADVDLVLDPGGRLRMLTASNLDDALRFVAVPVAPPPDTPARYPLRFDVDGYVAVVPVGTYRIVALVDVVFGTQEVDVLSMEVAEGESPPITPDLEALAALGDLF